MLDRSNEYHRDSLSYCLSYIQVYHIMTRDRGKAWNNVSIPRMIYSILQVSACFAGTVIISSPLIVLYEIEKRTKNPESHLVHRFARWAIEE